jgi:hypothetical protein
MLVLTVPLAACLGDPKPSAATPADDALVAALQGAWCVSDDDGRTCWGYDRFEGTTIRACGRLPEDDRPFSVVARLAMKDRTACYTVTETDADSAAVYPVGHQFCATVLEINDRFQRYLLDGTVYTTYRVPMAAVACPGSA